MSWDIDQEEAEECYRERVSCEASLGELLATIHRDGGHYQIEHGTEKAVRDAIDIVLSMRARLDDQT